VTKDYRIQTTMLSVTTKCRLTTYRSKLLSLYAEDGGKSFIRDFEFRTQY